MPKGKELTPKQKAFCDEYLTDLNGARAYKAVYKSIKNDATARANASRALTNANVKAYIAERMKEIQNEKTADLEEVIRFFSSVMRGEVKDQFDLDATISDRLSPQRWILAGCLPGVNSCVGMRKPMEKKKILVESQS